LSMSKRRSTGRLKSRCAGLEGRGARLERRCSGLKGRRAGLKRQGCGLKARSTRLERGKCSDRWRLLDIAAASKREGARGKAASRIELELGRASVEPGQRGFATVARSPRRLHAISRRLICPWIAGRRNCSPMHLVDKVERLERSSRATRVGIDLVVMLRDIQIKFRSQIRFSDSFVCTVSNLFILNEWLLRQ